MPPKSEKAARRVVAALSGFAVIALIHSGCAPAPSPETALAAAAAPAQAEMQEMPVCRVNSALLVPQSAPDCVFARPDLKTLDPDQWARLKVEYERQCYQRAEFAVRERLRLLQAASRCEALSMR